MTPESVPQRLGRPVDEMAAHLEDMARKGLLFRLEKGGAVKYGAVPFVHGLLEFQITRLGRRRCMLRLRDLCGALPDGYAKAISLGENDVSVADLDRCIGCGLCVVSCPTEAARLAPKLFFWSGTRCRSATVVSGNSFWFDFSDTYVGSKE